MHTWTLDEQFSSKFWFGVLQRRASTNVPDVANPLPFDPVFEIIFDLESDWVKNYVALNAQRIPYVVCMIIGSTMKKLAGGKKLVQLFRRWQVGLLGGWYVMVTCGGSGEGEGCYEEPDGSAKYMYMPDVEIGIHGRVFGGGRSGQPVGLTRRNDSVDDGDESHLTIISFL